MTEFPDLELERLKRELLELKTKLEKYEQILKDNDLLESVPITSDAELICSNQISKYKKAVEAGAVLTLEETKILDLLVKNLLLARGKTVPDVKEKKNKKEDKPDVAKLLQIAGTKITDE
jgi:hypothetical protein